MSSIGQRIRARREEKNLEVSELAARVGLAPSTIYGLEGGASKSTTKLHRIAEVLDANVHWLETGRGPIEAAIAEPGADYARDRVFVSRIDGVKLSAGSGEFFWDWEEIDNSHAFRHEWMAKKGLRAERCKLYDVRGESMSPTINNGDTVLINLADREIIPGEVYALVGEEGLRVKRLQKRGGIIYMHSDNQLQPGRYPDEAIEDGSHAVIGRVVWKAGAV